MSSKVPLAFDLETTGFEPDAQITVAGLASEVVVWLVLNTDGRSADEGRLRAALSDEATVPIELEVRDGEAGLLDAVSSFADDRLGGDRHYLCAYNGETWRDGFDLPFLRTACVKHGVDWPFPAMPYVDTMTAVQRFNTGDAGDLVEVYDQLIGGDHDDPFDDSEAAVEAFEAGDWLPLLRHNLADVIRTYELAKLSDRYVPASDHKMKNLSPPSP